MTEPSRVDDLEVLVAHQSRTIEELSDELRRQGETVDRLQAALRQLGERFQALEDTATPHAEATKPPHY